MALSKTEKKFTPLQAKEKIYHYCAYQERSHREVKEKLYSYHLYSSEVDELLTHLIVEGYVNEDRFAKAYAGGKFRVKQWGKIKIINGLKAKGVSKNCIKSGLKEIDEDDYQVTLKKLLEKKIASDTESNPFKQRDKIGRYAIAKGFEPELVWEILKDLILLQRS